MLGQRAAVAAESRTDENVRLPEADHRLGYAERAAEVRRRDDRLGEAHAQARAAFHGGEALIRGERRRTEIAGVLERVRTAAPEHFARQIDDLPHCVLWKGNVFSAKAQGRFLRVRSAHGEEQAEEKLHSGSGSGNALKMPGSRTAAALARCFGVSSAYEV